MTQKHPEDNVMHTAEVGFPPLGSGTMSATVLHATVPELSQEEIARYSRHMILPEVGMDGQRHLKVASILLIGAGGLGSPLGLYLAVVWR
jgi:adenylyltransferase/sulfurtransferase